jgi:FkbM family methyltransferase
MKGWFARCRKAVSSGISVLTKLVESRIDARYRFSLKDALLYWKEVNAHAPAVEILDEAGENYHVRVQGISLYWPKTFSRKGLPWLYNEVYSEPGGNPSCYTWGPVHIPTGGWTIDAGACEGFFSRFAFRNNAGKVVAIEPIPAMGLALESTFAAEKCQGRFSVIPAALGKTRGTTMFDLNALSCWDAHSSPESHSGFRVEVQTLDALVESCGLKGDGLIKMDIEGVEMDALEGARNTLKALKPQLAIAVYHGLDNAIRCRDIIISARPDYQTRFRGMYAYCDVPRPYMLFAW